MESNPLRSKEPEQPRDLPSSQLVDMFLDEAEKLLPPGQDNIVRPVDVSKVSDFLFEAYQVEINISAAHIEVTQFSYDLLITLEDDSFLKYQMDNGITESTTEAEIHHLTTYGNSKMPELTRTKDMNISEFVVLARTLDTLKQAEPPTL